MNQTEGILSFSINLPEMKIGIGFFFYLRKENGGSGVLINVIVNSIDNSNLPAVCRYCRLIIFFTNVETF